MAGLFLSKKGKSPPKQFSGLFFHYFMAKPVIN